MLETSQISGLMDRSALIVIDMQHDFLDPDAPYACADTNPLIENTRRLCDAMRSHGAPIIYTREVHRADGVDRGREGDSEPIHCVEGTRGVEIVPQLTPHNGDYIVDKRRFSSFFQTDLAGLLNGLRTELIVVSGVTANACVLTTVIDAFQYDFHTVTIQDCVSSKVGLLLDENYNDMMRLYKFYSNPLRLDSFLALLED